MKTHLNTGRLRTRATLGVLVIVSVGVFVFGTVSLLVQRSQQLSALEQEGRYVAEMIGAASVQPIQRFSYFTLYELAVQAEQSPRIVFCEIYDADRRSLVAFEGNYAGQRLTKNPRRSGSDVMIIEHPIEIEGELIGTVELGLSRDSVESEVWRRVIWFSASYVVLVFVLAAGLRHFLQREMIGPVVELSDVTSEISEGRFVRTDMEDRTDEIGDLARSFNQMSSNLEESYQELNDSNRRLESLLESSRDLAYMTEVFLCQVRSVRAILDELPFREAARVRFYFLDPSGAPGWRFVEKRVERTEEGRRRIYLNRPEDYDAPLIPDVSSIDLVFTMAPGRSLVEGDRIGLTSWHRDEMIGLVVVEGLEAQALQDHQRAFLQTVYQSFAVASLNAHITAHLEQLVESRTLELTQTNEKLSKTMQALWGEMELARKIQTALLSGDPDIPGYDCAVHMQPAAKVGGDYYDVIVADDGRPWWLIGDVSGHGVPAGLIMMMAQTAIRAALTGHPEISPAQLLSHVNRVLARNVQQIAENRYMTICAIQEVRPGELMFSGLHLDLLVYRKATNGVEVIPSRGFWLGMEPDISDVLHDDVFTLHPGDVLLLYTDGITEAHIDGSLLDEQGLIGLFRDLVSLPAAEIRRGLVDALEGYDVSDDTTLIVVKRSPDE